MLLIGNHHGMSASGTEPLNGFCCFFVIIENELRHNSIVHKTSEAPGNGQHTLHSLGNSLQLFSPAFSISDQLDILLEVHQGSHTVFNEYPDILTVPDVAKALGIGERSIYNLIRERKLGHLRIGKNIIVPKICLIEFINKFNNCPTKSS